MGLAVTLRVELPDSVDAETCRKLVEQPHQVCPYSNTTRGNIGVAGQVPGCRTNDTPANAPGSMENVAG